MSPTLQLLAGAVLISFSPVFVTLAGVPPTLSAFYRVLFGGFALLAVAGHPRGARIRWPLVAACGMLFGIDLWFWHRSILAIGPGLSTLVANTQVLFLAVAGVLLYRERPGWRLPAGILLAGTGLVLVVGLQWAEVSGAWRTGMHQAFATALTYSLFLLLMRHLGRDGMVLQVAIVSLVTAAVLAAGQAVEGGDFSLPDGRSLLILAAYGLLCQAAGWLLISRSIGRLPASRSGLLLLMQPTLALVWGALWFDGRLTALQLGGVILVLAGIYLGNLASSQNGEG